MLDFLLICRNNEEYFMNIFPRIYKSIEILEPNFYIYENNSTDNTKNILKHFKKTLPNFFLLSENTISYNNRYKNICIARNNLLDFYRKVRKDNNDNIWVVLFDTNIIFNSKSIIELINNSINGGVMFCSNTSYYDNKSNNYYYDLLALNYGKYFNDFNITFDRIKEDCRLFKNENIIQLESGFGGLVLIKKDIILKNNWHLIKPIKKYNNFPDTVICEHWYFCQQINKYKIFMVKNSKALWYLDKYIENKDEKKIFYNYIYKSFNLK